MIDKHAIPTKLLWIDLEMTGLRSEQDVILEIAAEVTDFDFKRLGNYDAILAQPEAALTSMNEWATAQHAASGLTDRVKHEGRPEADVVQEFCAFIRKHFGDTPAILAGNSIHKDREFIKQWWPEVDALLHYRMLDVTSLKIYMQGKHGVEYKKREVHRAFDDIQESMAEWQYYLAWLSSHTDATQSAH